MSLGSDYLNDYAYEIYHSQEKTGKWKSFIDKGYVECPFCGYATYCDCNEEARDLHFCFYCGAELKLEE